MSVYDKEAFCGRPCCKLLAEQQCSRCRGVKYCSQSCQLADWQRHRSICEKGPVAKSTKRNIAHAMHLYPELILLDGFRSLPGKACAEARESAMAELRHKTSAQFHMLTRRNQGRICRGTLLSAIAAGSSTAVTMRLTAPDCPLADRILAIEVRRLLRHGQSAGYANMEAIMSAPEIVRRRLIKIIEPDQENRVQSQLDQLFERSTQTMSQNAPS